jgi:hypothetical protein
LYPLSPNHQIQDWLCVKESAPKIVTKQLQKKEEAVAAVKCPCVLCSGTIEGF